MPNAPLVLVVDDFASNRMLATMILEQSGFRTVGADSASAAMDLLASQPVDLILLDRMLGDDDGLLLIQSIRDLSPAHESIPIIVVSADDRLTRRQVQAHGANDLVAKPLDMDLLASKISMWTRQSAAPKPTTTEPVDFAPRSLDSLQSHATSNPQFTEKIIAAYVTASQQAIAQIVAAQAAADATALWRAAHSLKGASATIGAPRLAALAGQLETLGRAGDLEATAAVVGDCQAAHVALLVILEEHRTRSQR